MEAADILGALQARIATLPGGRDLEGRPLLLVSVPSEGQSCNRDQVQLVLRYFLSIFSAETRRQGLFVLVDAQRSAWRSARAVMRQVNLALGAEVAAIVVLRPEAFWDKQRVDNCAKSHKDGEPVYIPASRLQKYVDLSQLPEELGGTWTYNHNQWIQDRIYVEAFTRDAEGAVSDLEKLRQRLTRFRSGVRVSSVEEALSFNRELFENTKDLAHKVLQAGKEVVQRLEDSRQDAVDTRQRVEHLLHQITTKRATMEEAWLDLEKSYVDARELTSLEDGVTRVTDWILGPAEALLNGRQQQVGFDVISAEELRQEHEALELQCTETYGHYAELLHKIDTLPRYNIALPDDLKSQRDFMDFVCRSFATRLERRRNVLITSLRFFRLVSEYFERTNEVLESLYKCDNVEDLENAEIVLMELQDTQDSIELVEREVVKEGEKLADILSMPVKDALGRDVDVNYEGDIVHVLGLLEATRARKDVFVDSVELHKLTLAQAAHIRQYEADAAQAGQWLDDLFQVMLKEHMHVGCNVFEIQCQKEEHQTFQETAKGTYEYGCQLLSAALALRQSCKLPVDGNSLLLQSLWRSWKRLQAVGQEQMTRLRVSAVFHRSVEEHCEQLRELMAAVRAVCDAEDQNKRRTRIHRFLMARERLLLEVGRMVRLGRLLRSRLREPLCPEQKSTESGGGVNATAVEAISGKLAEVTNLAEQLDATLCGAAQHDVGHNIRRILDGTASSTPEEWYSNMKTAPKVPGSSTSTGTGAEDSKSDDEFVTASECTCTPPSRSSSFHTASDGASPWWEVDPLSDAEADTATGRQPQEKPVVKTTTQVTKEMVIHEVTETTRLKLTHGDTLGVTSFLLTTERSEQKHPMSGPEVPQACAEQEPLLTQLKESREWLQLKVLEVNPELTKLGASLQEAAELQRAHDDVLLQLQNKQSPVEELLKQADQLISTQKTRAEVYAAMAESLGLAWKDVNAHLEQRKSILELNVAYQSRAEECLDRMRMLEMACNDEMLPVEIDAVKELLAKLHELKRSVLEALMPALQHGKLLIEKLKEIATQGTLDSRPDNIKVAADCAISQVEHWLETLHDRRRLLEIAWQSRKTQLEHCLKLTLLASDLKELEDILTVRKEAQTSDHLGDSTASAELLLHEHKKLLPEAKELQERALKITKATEELITPGHFAAEQATAKAYSILNLSSEYLEAIEQRETLLSRAILFFRSAHTALTKLDQLEVQLKTPNLPASSPQVIELHSQIAKSLDEITAPSLQEGYSLLELIGRGSPGAEGVKRMVDEIENRKLHLGELCTAHREENVRLSQAYTSFLEKQNELFSWLVSIAEAFLQGHQDMGSVLAMAKDFLELHHQLLNDLQKKGVEINALLLTLPPILEHLDDSQREDVDQKVDALHSHWLNLKSMLETRIDLAVVYVRFHTLAVQLANDFDAVEEEFKKSSDVTNEETIRLVEQKWLSLQQLYGQLKSVGKNFLEDASQVQDPHLDIKRASLCVETLLEHFGGRQFTISESWQTWQTSITVEREFKVQWETYVIESKKTVDWVSKIDVQLYPVLTTDTTSSKAVAHELEEKLQVVVPEVKKAQAEVELRIKALESLAQKGGTQEQKEELVQKLLELHNQLQAIVTDYQILLQMLIAFFKNLAELEKTIENLQSHYKMTYLPKAAAEVDLLLKEHDASRQAVLEMFKFTHNESEQIISRIKKQEPESVAQHDIDRVTVMLQMKQQAWETAWAERKLQLEQHQQLCQFDSDLHQINSSLSDLSAQLGAIRGQYGESLASAKATSVAFVYFEKTIELLELRIQTFMKTAEEMLSSEHGSSSHIERELKQLQERWAAFHRQVQESRRLIDLSIQYFELVEEAEEWFREGSKLLLTIARKSTTVRLPEEATQLLNEVEYFLKPGETRQDERIRKISSLAVELYGEEKSKQVTLVMHENKEMLESFTVISEELTTLAKNLRAAEEERERQKKEQEEVDASLAAARAEAAAAKAAASAADEARKAAEAAAKALREAAPFLQKAEFAEAIPMPPSEPSGPERPRKSPSPPLKKAKFIEELPQPIAPVFTVPLKDYTVEEGERFTYECRVTGFPMPEVIWYKDGISIQNNPDYRTTFDQGICTLTIEETFTEDSARFTCKAANAAGTAETNATLYVEEAEPEEQLTPPVFTKRLAPATTKEGSDFDFKCKVEGNPLPTVQWFKNDVCIDSSPDYVITYNNGEAVLHFEEVYLDDQAEYSCKATNQVGTDSCNAKLNVEPMEPSEIPVFIAPLTNVMARAGQKIKLECEVKGIPIPGITWSHNGKPVKESRDTKMQYVDNKATLVINEAFPKDAGVYIVSAKNIVGEATSACNVSVKGRLPTETSDSELASDMEPVKPSIQLPLKDLSVFEGKRVRLDCIIVGLPEPEVIWYHNSHPVKESTDFKLLFQGDRCSLVIDEAYLEDAGEYKVVAINSGGEASSKCKLTIQSVGETEPATRVPVVEEMEQVGEPPRFIKLLTDILAPEGEKVTFECIVQGDPRPDTKWYLNNEEINASERLQITSDEEGNVHLTIPELSPEDKGVYTVKAFNSCGEAKCFANLIVKTVSSPEIKRKTIELEPPAFKELFADRSVNENETTKFECAITGKPQPHVEWYFNNKVVAGKDFVISSAGERHTLTVLNVLPDHIGEIACVAENEAGKATCLAHLSVIEKPTTNIIVPLENNVSQHQESLVTMKRSMIVQSSKTTSSITTESIEPHVEIHSYRSQTEESMEQVDDKPAKEVKRQKVEEFHKVDQEQPVVREQTFVKIVNGVKDSQESASPQQIASPKVTRKSIAPRFVTPLNGKIVDQGADVILEGIIDGYPQPVVSWYKNGQDLSPKEGLITISWELNRARLELKNVGIKDAGRYTCKAANNVGTASSTADVVVKKTIFPPVFGRRLQAQAAKIGERVVMGAEVTGTPDPVVTWYKDGKPIAGAVPGGPFKTKIQGNSYSLVIEKAEPSHSGKYTIKAVNAGGEAQCIADFLVLEPEPQQDAQEPNLEMVTRVVFKDMKEERIQTDSQQHQTTTEKIVQHQLPEIVKPVTTESGTSPILVSPQRTSPLTTTTESVLLTETTKTEKHMSIKIERTPSPSFPRAADAPSKEDTHREVQIPVNIEQQKDTKPKEDKVMDIEKSKEIKKPEEYTIPITIETKKPEEDKSKEVNLPIINQLEQRNYEEMRQTKVQVKQIEIKKAKEMDVPLTFYDPELIPEMGRVTKVKIPVTVEKSDVEEHKEIWVPVVIEREEKLKPEAIKDLEPPEAVIPMEVEVKKEEIVEEEEEEEEEEEVTEEGVQDQSISKQSAYEFFMSKLHNGDDEIKDKPLKEPDPILANTSVKSNISQFQEYIASKKTDGPPAPLQQLESVTHFMEQPPRESPSILPKKDDVPIHTTDLSSSSYIHREQSNIIKSEKYVTHHITHQHTSSTSSSIEEFNLQPEPPPEICFIPKSEVAGKLRLDMPTRVKQLEESHRVLSPVEIPSGAIKIFPTPDETKPTATVQKPPVQKPVEEIMKKEVVEEVSVEKKVHLPGTGDWTYRHISHAPPQQSVQSPQPAPKPQSPVVSKSYERDEKMEIITPPISFQQTSEHLNIQRDFEVQRPMSPKPSAQGLAMEKLWASRRTPEPEIVSLPAEPIKRPITPQPAPPPSMKTHFQESSSISAFSSYEVKDIRRAASPRPSAEGVAMEKLWTPQKPQEPEPVISRPVSRGPQGFTKAMSPKPSVEGLAMDKIWAHKNPDVALKKTWPPPQPSEEKPVIPWAAKNSKEKVWPPPELALETPEKVTEIHSEIVKAATLPQKEEKLKHTVEQERYTTTTETQVQESSWRKQHTQEISPPQVETLIPPQKPSPMPQHYIAETTVMHSSALLESEIHTSEVTTTEHIEKISEHKEEMLSNFESFKSQIPENEKPPSPPVIEERTLKPSQAKQMWPPVSKEEYEPKPPALSKTTIPRKETPSRPQSSVEEHVFEPIIEPGPPPEIGFAPPPPVERRQSYVESIEQDLEKDLEKEPSRHLVGAVRTIPPPPQKEKSVPPPPLPSKEKAVAPPLPPKQKVLDSRPQVIPQAPKPEIKKPVIASKPFERFPDLEAFPFTPGPEVSKPAKCAPPPKPSKFVKGDFAESDYESDFELIHIAPKWRPYESDTEEKFCYRKVLPPTAKHRARPHSTEPEPLPPSKFDKPPQFEGPPRPAVDKVQITKKETHEVKTELTKVSTKTEIKTEKKKHHHHHHHHHQESKKKHSPPALKPGSPPIYIQPSASPAIKQDEKPQDTKKHEIPVKAKPESPKSKPKQPRNEVPESGYMADTDEPRYLRQQQQQQQQQQQKFSHHRHEEISRTNIEQTTVITSQSMTQQQKSTPIKPHPSPKFHHKHSEQKAEKKTTVTSTTTPVKQKELTMVKTIPVRETPAQPTLEPFPFKVEPQKPVAKRTLYPPPPSPSRFVKGDFRESDYESDYEGKIPPKWHPHDSDAEIPTYKPVRPLLTPGGTRIQSRASAELRSPTPPTEFDQPPNFGGPPRPKFEPIEKAAPTVKLQEILKPAEKSHKVYKPTPLTPRAPSPIELVVATPAVKEPELKPGTPPEMGYIPPPSSYPNATQTETSKIMKFAESTEHSHRVVSVQQTTRVIKFGETEKKRTQFESKTEPFPFKPEPEKPRKKTTLPPPTTPKRFTPGEFRESDYESDYEGIRIKPKWAPSGSDTDEPHYRKVKPPSMTRSSSVPAKSSVPVSAPMEFDTQPPAMPTPVTIITKEEQDAEHRRLKRVEEMRKRFSERTTSSQNSAITKSQTIVASPKKQDVVLQPGEPPEFGFVAIPPEAACVATKHLNEMTTTFKSKAQRFVDDIITDVKTAKQNGKPEKVKIAKTEVDGEEPQAYREESRVAQYGTKHIDPDTGLIYFKYDFGYEFGIVLPGEGKQGGDDKKKKLVSIKSRNEDDIEVPVIHETTKKSDGSKTTPQFRPKKVPCYKGVKWEPVSESEMSEAEGDTPHHKKRYSLPQAPHILIPPMSPLSISPSLPSLSPRYSGHGPHTPGVDSTASPGSSWQGISPNRALRSQGRGSTPTPPSTPSTPGSTHGTSMSMTQPRKPPTFITPLRDIAVVSGQTARFECIVQAEPPPNILWSKNGRIIENSNSHQIQYRNGVCRLTIPQAFPEDAGTYTCTATNMLGTIGTTGTLQVPGERRSVRV